MFGGSGGNTSGPEALVLWQLIGAGVSMVVAPMAYSCKVSRVHKEKPLGLDAASLGRANTMQL